MYHRNTSCSNLLNVRRLGFYGDRCRIIAKIGRYGAIDLFLLKKLMLMIALKKAGRIRHVGVFVLKTLEPGAPDICMWKK